MSDKEKTPLTDDVFLKAAQSTLEENSATVDDDVRQRLQQARRAAVRAATHTAQRPSKSTVRPGWLVPAGSFAVVALVSSVVMYLYRPAHEPSPVASIEDFPILTAPEELELYEELDFYQWLAEEQGNVG